MSVLMVGSKLLKALAGPCACFHGHAGQDGRASSGPAWESVLLSFHPVMLQESAKVQGDGGKGTPTNVTTIYDIVCDFFRDTIRTRKITGLQKP